MQTVAIKLYERLKEKIGSEEATLLIDFIDERVKGEVATKEDIHELEQNISTKMVELEQKTFTKIAELEQKTFTKIAELEQKISAKIAELEQKTSAEISSLKEKIYLLDKRVSDLEWKMKLYFILLAVLIIITNPGALEFFGKIIGVVK